MVFLLLSEVRNSYAQNPIRQAASEAKVTPDLLSIQTFTGAPIPAAVRGLEVRNEFVMVGNTIAIEAVSADGDAQTLLRQLQSLGLREGVWFKRMVSGYLPIDRISDLKSVPGLKFARPAYQPQHNAGAVTTQGDIAIRANVARQTYGVSGAGSTVGILSDSYNKLGGAGAGVASGDLPTGVQVLLDFLQPSAIDEGRALAEVIHDVAPGAAIAFHTAEGGQPTFANGIKKLAAAGCNIIVDDIVYYAEPFFQDGVVAQAADEVVRTNNVSYFSAAGNQARSSYQSRFYGSAVTIPGYGQAHDFGGGDTRQRVTIPAGGTFSIALQWDEPFFSVSGPPGAQSDLDILIYSVATGGLIAGSFSDQSVTGDPFEFASLGNTGTTPIDVDVVITKFAGPGPGLLKWVNFGSRNVAIEYDTKSSTLYGHNNVAGVICVGAAAYYNTPAFNPDLSTAVVDDFSSVGGTPILFTTTGQRINGTTGVTHQKPDITAVDGGNTTFFYPDKDTDADGFPNFFGTSAAAPHAAAVAALMQQKAGNTLTPARILSVLQATALDMDDPDTPGFDAGFDWKTGYGFIQADRALQALSQPLALVQPGYDCATGQITFNTTGGDGSPIEYRGIGIVNWNRNPMQYIDAPVRADPNSTTVYLQARQSGIEVRYTFNFRDYCRTPGEIINPPVPNLPGPTGSQPLALIAPLYDCATGYITMRTINGNGSPITYSAPGVRRNALTDATGVVEDGLRGDPKPLLLTATQSGITVSYTFDLGAFCAGGGTPPVPPVTPSVGAFALIEPVYSCATGIFTFRSANAAPGKVVEYYSVPGITDWSTSPTHSFNYDLRTAGDVKPFTLRARYVGEPGSEVTIVWVRPDPCSSGARLAASELGSGLQVTVLGNPTREEQVEIDVVGTVGTVLHLRVSDDRGACISEQTIETSGTTQRQRVVIGHSPGTYLLQVGTDTERKTLKIVRQ